MTINDPLLPLLQPVASLPGVSAPVAARIAHVTGGPRVLDLLFHLPETYVDRRNRPTIRDAQPGAVATLEVEVVSVSAPGRGTNQPFRVIVSDGTGFAEIPFWRTPPPPAVKPGRRLMISGRIESFGDRKQVKAPRLVELERRADLPELEPVWPLTGAPDAAAARTRDAPGARADPRPTGVA